MTRALFAALTCLFLASCGGGGADSPAGPVNANVSGGWTYSATNLTGGGATCNASGVVLTINQSGSTFTGSYSGGTITCSAPGVPTESGDFGTGTVANGTIAINSVAFNFDTSDWANTGTVSGNSMSGTAVVRVSTGQSTYILTGNFGATRR